MNSKERKLANKVRNIFDRGNIDVDTLQETIFIWYGITQRSASYNNILTQWIPYSGGPLYGQTAVDSCLDLIRRIGEYKGLLPKELQDYKVVLRRI